MAATLAAVAFSLGAVCGCDSSDPGQQALAAPIYFLKMSNVAALLPGEITHLATDARNRPFFTQESDAGNDAIFTLDGDRVTATGVSAASLARLAAAPAAVGHIQSIAGGAETGQWIYFYYCGVDGPNVVAIVGRFSADTGKCQILCDAGALKSLSGLGASISLARGKLMAGGNDLWLWLHNEDAGAILRFDLTAIDAGGRATPTRPWQSVTTDGPSFSPSRAGLDIAAAADGTLVATDPWEGVVWSIDGVGDAHLLDWITGISQSLSSPTTDAQGRAMFFVGDDDPYPTRGALPQHTPVLVSTYPSAVFLDGTHQTIMESKSFRPDEGIVIHDLQIRELVRAADPNAWLAYDRFTGRLLKIRLVAR